MYDDYDDEYMMTMIIYGRLGCIDDGNAWMIMIYG